MSLGAAYSNQVRDFELEVARGNIAGITHINKFGRSTNVDNGVATDVWDRANVVDDQDIWVAPTSAVIHNIKSSSASDAATGVGTRTLEIFGISGF